MILIKILMAHKCSQGRLQSLFVAEKTTDIQKTVKNIISSQIGYSWTLMILKQKLRLDND